ncbi:hypothetical protein KEU06_20415 [Pseudaminobacter sp. 19-2017]|uniref:Uncharacterized protein n=1 Tax=Pseudaminobacter soli (ex Zhang et al. 2022) TaxID=2831468 RepID=A0A942E4T2_9HYPH|nr:hypothetical protein [Pseudaminobacter soli]MBS3650981.1 hypothetical protein [Pseudaminobacter soli]
MHAPSRRELKDTALAATIAGTIANLAVTATLGALARGQGKSPLQPINATSHFFEGPQAGKVKEADLRHTGTGFLTNHAASIFWALPLQLLISQSRQTTGRTVAGAALVSGLAALVDYGLMPKRLTPGWEHALPARSVAIGFGALAVGLAAGSLIARRMMGR